MRMIERVSEDIVAALEPAMLADTFNLDRDGDLREQMVEWLAVKAETGASELATHLDEYLGRIGVDRVLRYLGLSFDATISLRARVDHWLEFRQAQIFTPSARPQELAATIIELAHQIRTTPDKFDSLDVVLNRWSLLLRYVVAFYAPELQGLIGRCIPDTHGDPLIAIENLSLHDLCQLVACDGLLGAEPYKAQSNVSVILANAEMRELLQQLVTLTADNAEQERTQTARAVSDCILSLIEQWQGNPACAVIPRGVVFEDVKKTAFATRAVCYDESRHRLSVTGVRAAIETGDNALIASSKDDVISAPRLRPLPRTEAWVTPGRTTCGLADVPRSPFRRRIRNQVFISYRREDGDWAAEVRKHLGTLVDKNVIQVWDDSKLKAGDEWEPEIRKVLQTCGVAILIITADYFESEFITKTELPTLLRAREDESVLVIPVFAQQVYLGAHEELVAIQGPNKIDEPLESLKQFERDEILTGLAARIRKVVEHS